MFILIQNKLSAQVQNNSSAQSSNVNLTNPITIGNSANLNSNTSQIPKTIYIKCLSNNDSTIVAPKVFDPLTMDSKPE